MSSESTEYVFIPVEVTDEFGEPEVPAGTVEAAFTLNAVEPEGADWNPAVWVSSGDEHRVKILIGPESDVALPAGRYRPWVRMIDAPEKSVKPATNLLVIY